jgi:hypothetical protein
MSHRAAALVTHSDMSLTEASSHLYKVVSVSRW